MEINNRKIILWLHLMMGFAGILFCFSMAMPYLALKLESVAPSLILAVLLLLLPFINFAGSLLLPLGIGLVGLVMSFMEEGVLRSSAGVCALHGLGFTMIGLSSFLISGWHFVSHWNSPVRDTPSLAEDTSLIALVIILFALPLIYNSFKSAKALTLR